MSGSQPNNLQGHLPALDAIRGIAILAVTAFRFREVEATETGAKVLRTVLDRGYLGVDLFFVLSGFLITGILFDTKDRSHTLRTFYFRRTLRIFPLYYLALILGLILLPAILPAGSSELAQRPQDAWALWFYGGNVALSSANDWSLGPFNHFWSLAVEEHFYLVWPWVIYCLNRSQAMRASIACVGIAIISKIAAVGLFDSPIAAEVLTLCRLDALGIGAWLALAARDEQGLTWLRRWWKHVGAVSLVAALTLLIGGRALPEHLGIEGKMIFFAALTPFAAACGALIIGAASAPPQSLLHWFGNMRFLHLAGRYSYGWYVFQGLIAPDINRYLTQDLLLSWTGGSESLAIFLKVTIGGGLSLLVAIASWHLFEAPLLRLRDAGVRLNHGMPRAAPASLG